LEAIVLKSASKLMREEGEKAFKKGLVTYFNGKKIEETYHIYGRVRDESILKELSTHIKINLKNKKLEGIQCTCEEHKEFAASGYFFMCSHLTATAFKFFSMIMKDKGEAGQRSGRQAAEKHKDEEKQSNKNAKKVIEWSYGTSQVSKDEYDSNRLGMSERSILNPQSTQRVGIGRLVRKISNTSIYYEGQKNAASDKIILKTNELRSFLESIEERKIKFKYDYLEFVAPILQEDLPVTFNIKERSGRLALTTHKKLPEPLNSKNDVYLFKSELYLPSANQIERYALLYEALKAKGEILYKKNLENYSKLVALLKSITKNINISEEVKAFAAEAIKPEFLVYKDKDEIFCEASVNYGSDRINILHKNNQEVLLLRNNKKEEKIIMEIEKLGFAKLQDKFLLTGGEEELFRLLRGRGEGLHAIGTVLIGRGLRDNRIYNSSNLHVELSEKEGLYDLSYNIENLDYRELNSAFSAYADKKSFYKTKSNSFIDLEDQGIQCFFKLFEVLNISEKLKEGFAQIEGSKAFYLYEHIKAGTLGFIKGTEALKEIEGKLVKINNSQLAIPGNFKGKLREYQIKGFRWFKTISGLGFGGILADEMGLGKTVQATAFILSEAGKNTLIVCPTSLIYNWKDELLRFAPSLKVGVVHGPDRFKILDVYKEYDVILTTYGTLRQDIECYKDIIFDFCFIDEAQNIKNSSTQNTRVIKQVKAEIKFALTGTPIENNLSELWSIFDFVMPGYLYSKEVFEAKFNSGSKESLENLKLLIKPFILRRTKSEVIKELPDKIEKKFIVEMTSAQKAVYNSYVKTVRDAMKSSTKGTIEVFSYLTKLRQICLEPSLLIEEYEGGSGKMNVAIDIVKNHIDAGGKVLLFSQFTSVLDKIGEKLSKEGIEFFRLDGKTKPQERIRLVKEFNESKEVKIFLISLKAGGTGLNLTSANLVIHFDPWWNPAVEDQASDRAHRIGQRHVVEVIKLVARGTIEEKILLLQEDKKELIGKIITGELQNSSLINKLSRSDLLSLFERSQINV
jgi:SNF2 family DNA or RNA helicase